MNSSASFPFSEQHFSLSTAEEAAALFDKAVQEPLQSDWTDQHFPSGTYRVVDGVLYRLIPGAPPTE